MKYLLLFALLYVAYVVWRNGRVAEGEARRQPAPPSQAKPLEMVSCPVCGVHLPRPDAVSGARGVLYCSHEHRQRAGG